ncbi:MAG: YfhO family protein [Anaerolineae bacterium]|nr:MAG: YfhO family protein [Anaerolineae bacterium]
MKVRRLLPDLLIALGLLLLPLAFFFPVTLGGKTLIPADNLYQVEPWSSYRESQGVPEIPLNGLLSDLILQNYQWKTFLRQSIDQREIPLWQPNQFSGTPFLANGQHSALYPFSIIYYVMPLETAYGWFTVSQLWLAGLFMYLFVRGLGLSRFAGMVAGVGYQLSSFFIVSTVHPMIQAGAAWLPLLLLMLEFIIQRRPFFAGRQSGFSTLPWVLIGGIALGMSFLAGHVEITYYTLLIMAMYALMRLIVETKWRFSFPLTRGDAGAAPFAQLIFMLILLVLLGFGLGAVQFIPFVETASDSFRTERSSLEEVRDYALPLRHVAKWLIPNVYGNPAHHEYVDIFTDKQTQHDWIRVDANGNEIRVTNTDFGIKNYVEGGVYVSILILVLAFIGLFFNRQAGFYRWVFFILGLIAAAFAFGTPLYAVLYYLFPGVNQLHTPFRWAWLITFVLCIFAAYGADVLLKNRSRWLTRAGIGLAVVGLTLMLLMASSRQFYDSIDSPVQHLYNGLAKASEAFPNAKAFYSYEASNIYTFGVMVFTAGLVLWLSQRKSPVWQLAAILVIVVDLYAASGDFNTRAEKTWLNFTPPEVAFLQQKNQESLDSANGPIRIQAFNWGERPLDANSGWRYGLQDVRGYDSLFSKQYADYMRRIAPQGEVDFNRIAPILYDNPQALLDSRLNALNVSYIITDWIIRPEEEFGVESLEEIGLEQVYESTGTRIYKNKNALPRAYSVAGEKPAFETLAPADFIPAKITRYESSTVFVDIEATEESWLILSDTYAPGWRAFVRPLGADEGEEKEIHVERVLENFRGVALEPGAWTVRFRYSPQSFQLGAFTSFVSGMVVIFLALLWLWTTFVRESADSDSARRVIKNSLAPIILNLFNRGIDFAFAFIMLRILGPEGAGIYYYAIVIFGWFEILTNFGLNTLLTRDVSRNRSQARNYLLNTTALRLALALLGIPALAIFLFIRNAAVSPTLDETALAAIVLLYIGLIPNSFSTGLTALFYAFEKAEYPAALTTVSTLAKVSLGLGALLMGWGVVGLAGASILTNVMTLVMMLYLAWPLMQPEVEKAVWHISPVFMRGMVHESWPLMLNHLLATIFFKSDVILMEAINGVEIVGIYSTAYKWLDALNIIPAFLTMALLPLMSRQAHEDKTALRRNYIFGFKSLYMVALPVAIVTTFIAPALIGILGGAEFLPDGGIALQIMIWSILVGWINSLTQYVLIALDRQRLITWAFIAAVSFNILANLIFLPEYSYRAAAVITIFSELALLVGFYRLIRGDLGSINFVQVLWRPTLAGGAMLGAIVLCWNFSPLLAVLASIVVYPAVLIIFKPLTSEEAERLGRVIPGRLRSRLVR